MTKRQRAKKVQRRYAKNFARHWLLEKRRLHRITQRLLGKTFRLPTGARPFHEILEEWSKD